MPIRPHAESRPADKVAGRLEVLRTRWSSRRPAGSNGHGARPAALDLASASGEEVFNLLGQHLGPS